MTRRIVPLDALAPVYADRSLSLDAIAGRLRITRSEVQRAIAKYGLPRRGRGGVPRIDGKRLADLHARGFTQAAIAKDQGVTPPAVSLALKRMGLR